MLKWGSKLVFLYHPVFICTNHSELTGHSVCTSGADMDWRRVSGNMGPLALQ